MPFPKFKTKEEIPKGFEEEYEEKDGEWVAKTPEPDPAMGEKGQKALERERTARKEAEKKAADAEKERDALKLANEAKEKGITEAQLKEIRDKEEAARKPLIDDLAKTKAENRKLKLTDRVQAAFLKVGGHPDRLEDAMLALNARTDLTEDDAESVVVKDKAGKVTAETLENFLTKTFRAEKPYFYLGVNAGGSGKGAADDDDEDAIPAARAETQTEQLRRVAGAF